MSENLMPDDYLAGTLVWAGDLTVNGEAITGVTVQMERAMLTGKKLPLYERVAIVPAEFAEGWTVKYDEWKRLADAAQWLARACKDRLPPGHFAKLEQEYSAVRAIFRPSVDGGRMPSLRLSGTGSVTRNIVVRCVVCVPLTAGEWTFLSSSDALVVTTRWIGSTVY